MKLGRTQRPWAADADARLPFAGAPAFTGASLIEELYYDEFRLAITHRKETHT